MPVVIVLLVLIILAELFLLMLRCRREHPGFRIPISIPPKYNATITTAPCFGKNAAVKNA